MLAANDLSKRFGDVVALDGCSLAARRGRVLGFLGANGAGKTIALMLAATWLMVRLAARIYTGALLRTGGRVPAGEALRAAIGSGSGRMS